MESVQRPLSIAHKLGNQWTHRGDPSISRKVYLKNSWCGQNRLCWCSETCFSMRLGNQKQCCRQVMLTFIWCSPLHLMRVHFPVMGWRNAHCAILELLAPVDMWWKHGDSRLQPILMSWSPIPNNCVEIMFYACQKQCRMRYCKRRKSGLRHTAMCSLIVWIFFSEKIVYFKPD